jgi:hypothetical protein
MRGIYIYYRTMYYLVWLILLKGSIVPTFELEYVQTRPSHVDSTILVHEKKVEVITATDMAAARGSADLFLNKDPKKRAEISLHPMYLPSFVSCFLPHLG